MIIENIDTGAKYEVEAGTLYPESSFKEVVAKTSPAESKAPANPAVKTAKTSPAESKAPAETK